MGFAAPIGLAVGGGLGFAQAQQRNQALESSMNAQNRALGVQQQQLVDQTAIERQRIERQQQQIEGRIRVLAGESGIGTTSGTALALQQQNEHDAGLNFAILDRNLRNNLAAVQTGAAANMQQLQSQAQNPLLSAFTGALTGMNSGLSIASAVDAFNRDRNTPQPEPFEPVQPPQFPTL